MAYKKYLNAAGDVVTPANEEEYQNFQKLGFKEAGFQKEEGYIGTPEKEFTPFKEDPYQEEVRRYTQGLGGADRIVPTAGEETQIREDVRKQMQSYIDAIDAYANRLIATEQQRGLERRGEAGALKIAGGLGASPRGAAMIEKAEELTTGKLKDIESERTLQKEAVLLKIDERADKKIELERTRALQNQETYMASLKSIRDDARDDVGNLAKTGVSIESLKAQRTTDGDNYYDKLLADTGYSELQLDSLYNAAKPQPDQYTEIQYSKNGNRWLKRIGFVNGQKVEYDYDLGLPYTEEEDIETIKGLPYRKLVDENGKITYEAVEGIKEEPDKSPTSVQEYEYYKKQELDAGRTPKSYEAWGEKPVEIIKEEKLLTPEQIAQYQYDYPDAGIKMGDTNITAQTKIGGGQEIDLTETTFSGLTATFKDGSKMTFPDQQSLDQFKQDNNLTEQKTEEGITPAKITTPIYGTSELAKKTNLVDRLKFKQDQNVKMGQAKNVGLREELAKEGYPIEEIDKLLNPLGTKLAEAGKWITDLFSGNK